MHLYGTGSKKGSWNDYVIDNNNVDAYIIEYGGMGVLLQFLEQHQLQ